MTVTRTFKVSGLALLAGILLANLGGEDGFAELVKVVGVLTIVVAAPVFAVSALRHLMRGLLWRVGSRLFVSYLLIGVLPLLLVAGLVSAALFILSGQSGARRAETRLLARLDSLEAKASEFAGRERARRPEAATGSGSFDGWALLPTTGAAEGDGPLGTHLGKIAVPEEGLRAFVQDGGKSFLVAARRTKAGTLFLYRGADAVLEDELSAEAGLNVRFGLGRTEATADAATSQAEGTRGGVTISASGKTTRVSSLNREERKARAVKAPGPGDEGLVHWFLPLDLPVLDATTGAPIRDEGAALLVRTSMTAEFRSLFGGAELSSSGAGAGAIALAVLKALGISTGVVYFLALLVAALLVIRIARAARRLSNGFAQIEKGNFGVREKLRGRDQLAGLIDSFNEMAGHLEASMAARAEAEALGRELAIARDLQRRLLPSPDFAFPGVELAADFRPAAAIGGDFYHFLGEGETRLTVVIADVAGHGLPAGIVMASALASLAALSRGGTDTPTLLAHLDDEVRRTTERRAFVTLAHVRFDLAGRAAEFTNAGHIYPYRVAPDGTVSSVENPSKPLGAGRPVERVTVTVPLVDGETWVLLSDGVVEAMAPDGSEAFGFERLESALARCGGKGPRDVLESVLDAWRAHTGGDDPEDDRTVVVVKVLSPSASAPSAGPHPPG
ncbi:MAG: SpoIIE family protein phosphatase [Holophagales bacterium]|nr:SpoIIE family protein phosphatase [Holophagales bacterium]